MSDLNTIARWLMLAGLTLAVIGALLWLAGRAGLPLGKLPGDIRIESGSFSCFIPIATSLVLSLALTILLNLIVRLFR